MNVFYGILVFILVVSIVSSESVAENAQDSHQEASDFNMISSLVSLSCL